MRRGLASSEHPQVVHISGHLLSHFDFPDFEFAAGEKFQIGAAAFAQRDWVVKVRNGSASRTSRAAGRLDDLQMWHLPAPSLPRRDQNKIAARPALLRKACRFRVERERSARYQIDRI